MSGTNLESQNLEVIAKRLTTLRKKLGITQIELAEKTNLERKSIIRYENAQNTPSGKALQALAQIFGVTSDYLLGLTDEPFAVPLSDSELSELELRAVHALRRAATDGDRQRLLDALNALVPAEMP